MNRKGIILLIGIVMAFFIGRGLLTMFWFGPIYDIKTFSIFYGNPDGQKLQELQKHDAVIVESSAITKQEIDVLKKSDVKVFGYVSLMQLENWNEELKKHISPSDYATLKGERVYVKDWDTYVMDLRESHYREALLWKINTYIVDRGFDGIFFDTVDDLDYYFHDDAKVQNKMREGYLTLLKEIKKEFPNLLIIQNRGFETIKASSRDYIDGVLWEGFEAKDLQESDWAKNWLNYLKKEQWWGRVKVWTVVTDTESLKVSEKHRFPAFMRTGDTYQD